MPWHQRKERASGGGCLPGDRAAVVTLTTYDEAVKTGTNRTLSFYQRMTLPSPRPILPTVGNHWAVDRVFET
jgi:hypothetical protein